MKLTKEFLAKIIKESLNEARTSHYIAIVEFLSDLNSAGTVKKLQVSNPDQEVSARILAKYIYTNFLENPDFEFFKFKDVRGIQAGGTTSVSMGYNKSRTRRDDEIEGRDPSREYKATIILAEFQRDQEFSFTFGEKNLKVKFESVGKDTYKKPVVTSESPIEKEQPKASAKSVSVPSGDLKSQIQDLMKSKPDLANSSVAQAILRGETPNKFALGSFEKKYGIKLQESKMKLTKEFLTKLIKEELEKTTLSEARYAIYAGKPSPSKPPIKIFASMEAAEAGKEQLYKEYPYAAVQKFKPGGMWELTVGEYAEKSAEPTSGGTGKYYVSIGAGRWAGPYDSHQEASLSHDRGIIRQFDSNPNRD